MKLKRIILLLLTVMFSFSYGEVFAKDGNSLKKALKNKFLIGVSVNTHQSSGKDVTAVEIVKKNFNSIVAENCMKSSVIHPKENKYNFAQADEFVSFACGQLPHKPRTSVPKPCESYKWQSLQSPISMWTK